MTAVSTAEGLDVARHQDTLARARSLENMGDEAEAERLFRETLDATRGTGTVVEWVALSNLTGLFQRQGRESESLILIRRLIDGAATFEPFRRTWALQARCMALANIEDWPRLADELPRFEAAIPGSPEPHLTIFGRSLDALRATAAIHSDDLEVARAAHESLVESLTESAAANTRRVIHLMGGEIALRGGRYTDAIECARRARPWCRSALEEVACAVMEGECLAELKQTAQARALILDVVERIEAEPAAELASAMLVRSGPRLTELVIDRCGDECLARRACDLSGIAVIRRAQEIERDMADLPELADPHPDDAAALAAFRARFAEDKQLFLRTLARLLGDHSGGAAFLRPERDGLVRVCAWCLRLVREDGTTPPVGHFVAGADHTRVTHGMCAACEASMRADLPARVA